MRRIRTALSLLLALLAGGAFAQSTLAVSPAAWDFGAIVQGDRARITVSVTSTAAEPVTVTLVPTCDCLTVEPGSRLIAASGRATFLLTYDSKDDTGIVKRVIIVRSSAPGAKDRAYLVNGVVRQVRQDGAAATAWTRSDQPIVGDGVDLIYYYTPGCRSCEEFLSVELPRIGKELSRTLRLQKRDILDPAAFEELSRFAASLGTTVSAIPALRVGAGQLLQGDQVIRAQARGAITAVAAAAGPAVSVTAGPAVSVADRLAVLPVILAGLVDGINPCAFTTLIFLLASLALAGRGRREVLVIGIVFSFSVFLTYFLVGLGFFAALRAASAVSVVSLVLRWLLVAVLVVFAGLSVHDFFKIRAGRPAEMLLQLPNALKRRIHASIRTRVRTAALVGSSLVLGFLVSIFEIACTGQVYLPTLAYLARMQGQANAIALLGLYNLFFIAPLLVVFGATYAGVGSARITKALLSRNSPCEGTVVRGRSAVIRVGSAASNRASASGRLSRMIGR